VICSKAQRGRASQPLHGDRHLEGGVCPSRQDKSPGGAAGVFHGPLIRNRRKGGSPGRPQNCGDEFFFFCSDWSDIAVVSGITHRPGGAAEDAHQTGAMGGHKGRGDNRLTLDSRPARPAVKPQAAEDPGPQRKDGHHLEAGF